MNRQEDVKQIEGNVYHFTNTARLPWIIADDELRPGANKLASAPVACIWATGSGVGDRTASAMCQRHASFGIVNAAYEGYRQGQQLLVRFTMRAADFFPWSVINEKISAWTADDVERFERSARLLNQPTDDWYCRTEPLPLDQIVGIHFRSYRDNRWKELITPCTMVVQPEIDALGIEIDGAVYLSSKVTGPKGVTGYACLKTTLQELQQQTAGQQSKIGHCTSIGVQSCGG